MTKEKKIKDIIYQLRKSDLPQILIDCFENDFSKKHLNLEQIETLKEYSIKCYKEHSEIINKLPNEVATCFIYDYCTNYNEKDEIVNNYSFYKGYKNIFYLMQESLMSGVFIIYNGISLQKDSKKYISDFSWGGINLPNSNVFAEKIRVSGNAIITAEVVFNIVFPEDEKKHNLADIFLETFLVEKTSYQHNSSFSMQDVIDWYDNLNLIKRTCTEQNLTYREFGEKVGFGEGAIKNAAASGKISDQLKRATEMLLEIDRLTTENNKFKEFQKLLNKIISLQNI